MKIVAKYNFNNGEEKILEKYKKEFNEIESIIESINASKYKTKKSTEKTMMGKMLYNPSQLNRAFKKNFNEKRWKNHKIKCDYIYGELLEGYKLEKKSSQKPYRDMDFVKPGSKLGVEVQFGKYAFMVYNVCAKMTIFSNLGIIDTGIEIVPVKNFSSEMSTGVSYFEQFAWDLENRGVSNIDIPVLILGIDKK